MAKLHTACCDEYHAHSAPKCCSNDCYCQKKIEITVLDAEDILEILERNETVLKSVGVKVTDDIKSLKKKLEKLCQS